MDLSIRQQAVSAHPLSPRVVHEAGHIAEEQGGGPGDHDAVAAAHVGVPRRRPARARPIGPHAGVDAVGRAVGIEVDARWAGMVVVLGPVEAYQQWGLCKGAL
jgi:hypothetical protein